MAKIRLYIAASLDGFISTPDGGVEWLDPFNGDDYGYEQFVEEIGTLVLGRKTFEQTMGFGVGWPYAGKEAFVLSSGVVRDLPEGASLWTGSTEALAKRLREGDQDAWIVGGARTIRHFLDAGAVDEIELFVMPVLLGDGVRLFERSQAQARLELIETETYPSGAVKLLYRVPPRED